MRLSTFFTPVKLDYCLKNGGTGRFNYKYSFQC